jgi:ParB/RepB/Spo0J family partition protein
MERLENLSVKLLAPPFVLLRLVDKNSLDYIELRDSIAAHGLFNSLCVRESIRFPGLYEVIDGLHRLCCALDCGLETVPCIIKDATDVEVKNWQMQANLIRRTTTNAQYAERLKMLFCENTDLTIEVLAAELHCRPGRLEEILRLNNLIDDAKIHLNRGELPLTSAYALSKLPKKLQCELFDISMSMSARDFISVCSGYIKAYKEAIKEGRLQNYLLNYDVATPHLRTFSAIRDEYTSLIVGTDACENGVFPNKLSIWKAALAWVLQLDPISLQKFSDKVKKRAETENQLILKRVTSNPPKIRIAKRIGVDPNDTYMMELLS